MLYGRVAADFALTSGVHSGIDALKAIMAGASVAMTTSELLQNGIPRVGEMLAEMRDWLVQHDYESIEHARGSMSQRSAAATRRPSSGRTTSARSTPTTTSCRRT